MHTYAQSHTLTKNNFENLKLLKFSNLGIWSCYKVTKKTDVPKFKFTTTANKTDKTRFIVSC